MMNKLYDTALFHNSHLFIVAVLDGTLIWWQAKLKATTWNSDKEIPRLCLLVLCSLYDPASTTNKRLCRIIGLLVYEFKQIEQNEY